MRVIVIGGTGHIGRFLVGQLVEDGHEVVVVTSGRTGAPQEPDWKPAQVVTARYRRDDAAWREFVAALRPEVVVDILQADLSGTYEAVRATCRHYVVCGSVWMLGAPVRVPAPEVVCGPAFGASYGARRREIEGLLARSASGATPLTAILPPNICGPGKVPLDCYGGREVARHRGYARGEAVRLPEGINTLIGPCDASDVAQGFRLAVRHRDAAAGRWFNVGAPYALTFPQFVGAYGEAYGTSIPIEYVAPERFYREIVPDAGSAIHHRHHMCPDIRATAQALGYRPRFTCEETLARAVRWMRDERLL